MQKEKNNSLSDNDARTEINNSLSDNNANLNELNVLSSTIEVVTDGEQPGLYLIIENIPSGKCDIWVNYSFGGQSYNMISDKSWYDVGELAENGKATLLCYELDKHPLTAFLSGASSNLYVQVSYSIDDGWFEKLEPIRLSNGQTYEIPTTPPPFSMDVKLDWFNYYLEGHFRDFPPNVA